MIDNRALTPDEWQAIMYAVVTVLFVLIVVLKLLTIKIDSKLESLKNRYYILDPCPFCGKIPEVKNGCYFCKKCRLIMRIPLRNYKSVEEMIEKTWNKRWKG